MRSPFLWLALLLHVALATAYAWRTPAFEGPDENSHYEYAWQIGNAGRLPLAAALAAERGLPQTEGAVLGHHPPLYYALVGGAMALAGRDDTVFGPRINPAFGLQGQPGNRLKFLHEAHPDPLLGWLRMLSVLLGAVTVVCVHRLGRLACPDAPRVADLAALLAACLPMFSAMHGLLNNDVLATTLATATLVALVSLQRRERVTTAPAIGAGALVGLALLTKLTAMFLFGLLGLVLLLALLRGRAHWPAALAGVATPLLISGWVFWRNASLYGDPLAMTAHDASFQPIPRELVGPYLLGTAPWPDSLPSFVPEVFTSLLGRFGWFSVPPHPVLIWTAAGVAALSLLGLLLTPAGRERRFLPRPLWLLLLAAALVFGGTLYFNTRAMQPQGRLLFPAIGPVAVLVAAGLVRLSDGLPFRRYALALLPATAITVFFTTFAPALDPTLAPAPPEHRSLVGGIVTPLGPRTIEWTTEASETPLATPPTLRWRDPDAPEGTRYTLYAFAPNGRVHVATHEWTHGRIEITGGSYTPNAAVWQFLPKGTPVDLRLRRVPTEPDQDPRSLPCSGPLRIVRGG